MKIRKKARYVNEDMCTGCGICVEKCPRKVRRQRFRGGHGLSQGDLHALPAGRAAHPGDRHGHLHLVQAAASARSAQKLCPTDAIDFEQQDEIVELEVGNIILATGWKLFDCRGLPQYGYGRLANVYTNLEFERLCNAAGPTDGKIVLRDGKTEPKSVAIIHCVGSRDVRHNEYCSGVCCMAALKFGHLVLEKTKAEGLFVLHRHAGQSEGLRGVLSAALAGRHALRPRQGGRGDRRRARRRRRRASSSSRSKIRCWASNDGSPSTWSC